MRTVNIGALKARLSAHIQLVRQGEEVIVCDRNKPVARIVPVVTEDRTAHEKKLIASGALVPPRRRKAVNEEWPEPPGNVSDEAMERIWHEEREGR
ncbi:MAG TPA: type II toxin-antitoxin system prevent-host-death family antitoxin [Terriglobales bacterium]|nr:type II toxin-antitoxin system prevent-host-death family antitoxin [Terriglobales bacterium]